MTRSHKSNNIMNKPSFTRPLLGLALSSACLAAHAYDDKWSGFGSIVAGKTFGACQPGYLATKYDNSCTRFIADYAHDGVYTDSFSAKPETRLGVQWTGNFTDQISATAQGMARTTDGNKVDLEWAYLTDKINSSWTVQVGRKRLPLYYYSDFQDAGYAYTMIRPSPDVYGWDVVNYNGANVDYSTDIGDWSVHASAYGGAEDSKKNKFSQIGYDQPIDVRWKNILGTSVELNHDWFTARFSYTQSDYQQVDHDTGVPMQQLNGSYNGKQSFYGMALIADYGDWLARTEIAGANRKAIGEKLAYFYVSGGRRFGSFTPMVQFSVDHEITTAGPIYTWVNRTASASVRYEVNKWSDLKVQFDRDLDSRSTPYTGTANVVAVSYDFVF